MDTFRGHRRFVFTRIIYNAQTIKKICYQCIVPLTVIEQVINDVVGKSRQLEDVIGVIKIIL